MVAALRRGPGPAPGGLPGRRRAVKSGPVRPRRKWARLPIRHFRQAGATRRGAGLRGGRTRLGGRLRRPGGRPARPAEPGTGDPGPAGGGLRPRAGTARPAPVRRLPARSLAAELDRATARRGGPAGPRGDRARRRVPGQRGRARERGVPGRPGRPATGGHPAARARYAGVLSGPGWAIACASPETLVEVRAGRVTTRPIKGTRPATVQGRTELLGSAKERAEHVMIVDLERNDLARVARTGSVRVDELYAVRRWCDLWQAESTVSAQLAPGTGLPDLPRAVCPRGAVAGSPHP